MNKLKYIGAAMLLSLTLAGCAPSDPQQTQQFEQAKAEAESLATEKGLSEYVLAIEIKQSHMFLDFGKNWKDDLNVIVISIPTTEEFYNAVEVGYVIDDSFRSGSLWMEGSVGNWDIKIVDKYIN